MHRFLIALALKLILMSTGLQAEELLGDVAAGGRLAEEVCSACHVVAPGREATDEVGAPAFPDLANQLGVTAFSLRVFLQTPHHRMPDFRLDRDETDNVVAYILSLSS
jgi:mono/diheme cytochrome c family protein